jgi:CRISPR-associated protein Csd2
MAVRSLLVFKHDNQLGKAPSHSLFDMVKVVKKEAVDLVRSFADYDLTIDEAAIPSGVSLSRRI